MTSAENPKTHPDFLEFVRDKGTESLLIKKLDYAQHELDELYKSFKKRFYNPQDNIIAITEYNKEIGKKYATEYLKLKYFLREQINDFIKGVKKHPRISDDYYASKLRDDYYFEEGITNLSEVNKRIKAYRAIYWHFNDNNILKRFKRTNYEIRNKNFKWIISKPEFKLEEFEEEKVLDDIIIEYKEFLLSKDPIINFNLREYLTNYLEEIKVKNCFPLKIDKISQAVNWKTIFNLNFF
jgi:hypothetical protein